MIFSVLWSSMKNINSDSFSSGVLTEVASNSFFDKKQVDGVDLKKEGVDDADVKGG